MDKLINPSRTHNAHADEKLIELADAYCRERGIALTPIRRKVLALLLETGRATKAYTLLDEMKKVHPGSAPPTIYRALDFLLSAGLIHRIESINAFAACHDLTHCRHGMLVVCQQCGSFSELDEPEIQHELMYKIHASGFELMGEEIELKGLCPACRRALAKTDVQHAGH